MTTTRFAPSPTGALHCGTIRTALFAWLLARHEGGRFILRIEDTDQKREVPGAVEGIIETLDWLGLDRDEGPENGGPHAPYVQSQRLDVYRRYAQQLLDAGLAYADPYSAEELAALRERATAEKRPFLYRDHRPEQPPVWDGSQPLRIRLEPQHIEWEDAVLGKVSMGPEMIDDFIIIKADGFPTYNFCHIIDDHEMGVTHVLRSQEFISSIPKFLAAHQALGWQPPVNAIVPPVLGPTGGTKLSKRKGAQPVLHYRDVGYLPEAMLNYMAGLGWNDGSTQEVYSVGELIAHFDMAKIQKSPARFDEQRLQWLNGQWLRRLSLPQLAERAESFWPESAATAEPDYRMQVLGLVQERLKTLADLPGLSRYFFEEPAINMGLISENKQLSSLETSVLSGLLVQARNRLQVLEPFTPEAIQACLGELLTSTGQKPGVLLGLIRVATTWAPFSPALPETLTLLGQTRSIERLDRAVEALQAKN